MVRTFAEYEIPSALRLQAQAVREEAWPGLGGGAHDSALDPRTMLFVTPDGEVTAALDILSKDLVHDGRTYRASGLSAVATAKEHRGKGHGRRLVAAAREAIARSGADVGLFTCDSELRRFYESAGWAVLEGTIVIGGTPEEPFPSDGPGFDKVTMAGFFTERALRNAHTFRSSRIGLYPGEIDRLW